MPKNKLIDLERYHVFQFMGDANIYNNYESNNNYSSPQ